MTVDLEDYYCDLPVKTWNKYESRIVEITKTILNLFERYGVTGTFFTLGYIAERHPELIEYIVSKGHEISSHGYSHNNIRIMNQKDFELDLVKSIEILTKIAGEKILGFRAPFFSINKSNLWAFNSLKKYLKYDSSLFPVRLHYGLSDMPYHVYRVSDKDPLKEDKNSSFIEFPMAILKLPLVGSFPIAGGIYLRLLPSKLIKIGVERYNKLEFPATVYFHPKDIDPATPHIQEYPRYTYWGLKEAYNKLESILKVYTFTSIREWMKL